MNERINELVKQCTSWSNGYTWTSQWEFDKEKFADLIAYECMDLALGCSHREDDMGAIIANKIKVHFGIK